MPAPTPKTILIVEDDIMLQEVARDTLCVKGFQVMVAQDGEEALKILSTTKPDLILSDVCMPRCDGFELLRRLRNLPDGETIPFIFMSAKAETSALREGMGLGADDYVTKPYLAEDLLRTINTRLARAEMIEDKLKRQERFLARVLPHELRTPLSGIIGFSDMMTSIGKSGDTLPPRELAEFGGSIARSGQRLLRVAEDFSLWSWLESTRAKEKKGEKSLSRKVQITEATIRDWCEERIRTHGREADLVIQGAPTTVEVPAQGLPQVISHLVENAIKYSPAGKSVLVTIVESGMTSEIRVTDSGRGMSDADLERVGAMRQFDREHFEQQGMGMGLALARNFAQLAKGALALVRNPEAAGMTASLKLPRADTR